MKLHVHKFSDSQTLATCREVDDAEPAPSAPFEPTAWTVAQFNTWKDSFVWSAAADPAFNAATHKLVTGPTAFNEPARTAIRSRVLQALNAAEIDVRRELSDAAYLETMVAKLFDDAASLSNAELARLARTAARNVLRGMRRGKP